MEILHKGHLLKQEREQAWNQK